MDGWRPPPETSNFYCLPGRAGGTPMVLEINGSARDALSKVAAEQSLGRGGL